MARYTESHRSNTQCNTSVHSSAPFILLHSLSHIQIHTLPSLISYVCVPAHASNSQRLCVTYVSHSVGGATSVTSVNKPTVSAPVPRSTLLGTVTFTHSDPSSGPMLQGMLCVWVTAQATAYLSSPGELQCIPHRNKQKKELK